MKRLILWLVTALLTICLAVGTLTACGEAEGADAGENQDQTTQGEDPSSGESGESGSGEGESGEDPEQHHDQNASGGEEDPGSDAEKDKDPEGQGGEQGDEGGGTPAPAETVAGQWTGATAAGLLGGQNASDAITIYIALDEGGEHGYAVVRVRERLESQTVTVYFAVALSGENGSFAGDCTYDLGAGTSATGHVTATCSEGALSVTVGGIWGADKTFSFPTRAELPDEISPDGRLYPARKDYAELPYIFDFGENAVLSCGNTANDDVVLPDAAFYPVGNHIVVTVPQSAENQKAVTFIIYRENGVYYATASGSGEAFSLSEERPAPVYTLTFSLGGCNGVACTENAIPAPLTADKENGYTVTLPAAPVWEGYAFLHWNIDGEECAPASQYTLHADAQAVAVWEVKTDPIPAKSIAGLWSGAVTSAGEIKLSVALFEEEQAGAAGVLVVKTTPSAGEPVHHAAPIEALDGKYFADFGSGVGELSAQGDVLTFTGTQNSAPQLKFTVHDELPASSPVADGVYHAWEGEEYRGQYTFSRSGTALVDDAGTLYNVVYVGEYGALIRSGENTFRAVLVTEGGSRYLIGGWKSALTDVAPAVVTFSLGDHAAEGSKTPAERKVKPGSSVSLPSAPAAAEGYRFVGWYHGEELAGDAGSSCTVHGSTTFTAHWEELPPVVQYSVSYVPGDAGSEAENLPTDGKKYEDGVEITVSDVQPGWVGHNFLGWRAEGDRLYHAGETYRVNGQDVVFVAQWETIAPPTYTVHFEVGEHAAHGASVAPMEGVCGEIELPEPPEAARGYAFAGWYRGETSVGAGKAAYTVTGDETLTAHWEAILYTVQFEVNKPQNSHGEVSGEHAKLTASLQNAQFSLPSLTLTGYEHTGWKLGGELLTGGAAQLTEERLPAEGDVLTLTAQWSAVAYTLRFTPAAPEGEEGEATGSAGDITVSLDDAQTQLPTLSFAGYVFKGWTTGGSAPSASFSLTEALIEGLSGGKVFFFTPVWEKIPVDRFSVTFSEGTDDDVTGMPQNTSAERGEFPIPAEEPTRVGYLFEGWQAGGVGVLYRANGENAVYSLDAAVEFVAAWRAVEYVVVFGNGNGAADMPSGATLTLERPSFVAEPAPSRVGYLFDGWTWQDEAPCEKFTLTRDIIKSLGGGTEIVLSAHWLAKRYTLLFDGGTPSGATGLPESMEVTLEHPTAKPEAPAMAGYFFMGWTWFVAEGVLQSEPAPSFTLTEAIVIALGEASSVTLTANWKETPVEYTFKFYADASCTGEPVCTRTASLLSGEPIPADDCSVRPGEAAAGYTFTGWFFSFGGEEIPVDPAFVPSRYGVTELHFYAAWQFHLEIGSPDNSLSDTGLAPVYTEQLKVGEMLTFSGSMTSRAEFSDQTLFAYLFPWEVWGAMRLDSALTNTANGNTVYLEEMDWHITKLSGVDADTFLDVIRDCNITLTFDWTQADVIRVIFEATGRESGVQQRMEFLVTGSLPESCTVGLGGSHSHTVLTSRTHHPAP